VTADPRRRRVPQAGTGPHPLLYLMHGVEGPCLVVHRLGAANPGRSSPNPDPEGMDLARLQSFCSAPANLLRQKPELDRGKEGGGGNCCEGGLVGSHHGLQPLLDVEQRRRPESKQVEGLSVGRRVAPRAACARRRGGLSGNFQNRRVPPFIICSSLFFSSRDTDSPVS
jgi:hypothetical protein